MPAYPDGVPAYTFVADLRENMISAYTDRSLPQGSEVQVAFEARDAFAFKGKSLVCNRISLGQNFIGTNSMHFQITAQCTFSSDHERKQYEAYLQELRDRFLFLDGLSKPPAPPTEASVTPITTSNATDTTTATVDPAATTPEKKAA